MEQDAEERKKWAERELEIDMYLLTMIEAGLAVRQAGLIWMLPLCHDAYGENI